METENHIQTLLHAPDPQSRYHAIDHLKFALDRPDVVEALIVALGDEGYYEVPEIGAPSYIYGVYERAVEVLTPLASQHFERIAAEMQVCSCAMLSGLKLMPYCGPAGARVIIDALEHPDPRVPPQAVTALGETLESGQTQAAPVLLEALSKALIHADVFVRSKAISTVHWYLQKRPEIDPVGALPPGLLEVLAEAVRSGATNPEAGWPYLPETSMLQACVHRVAQGAGQTAYTLGKYAEHLDDAMVAELCSGTLTRELVELWGRWDNEPRRPSPSLSRRSACLNSREPPPWRCCVSPGARVTSWRA